MKTELEYLKELLDINDSSKDNILNFLIGLVSKQICNYCRINAVPIELKEILISICVDIYKQKNYGAEGIARNIKSISEGDISITYEYDIKNEYLNFLKNYKEQLDLFRCAGW